MADEWRTIQSRDLTLIFPLERPVGIRLDPTDVVIDQEGQVIVPIWRPEDEHWKTFRLHHMVVPTLAAAIRQDDHILTRYGNELKGIAGVVAGVEFALGLYLKWDSDQFVAESNDQIVRLKQLANWLDASLRPEKRRARDQLYQVIIKRGRDRQGRYNPQVIVSHLFAVIYHLWQKRRAGAHHIVVEIAGRKAMLELTRQVNLATLQCMSNELMRLIDLPLFRTRARPAALPYHEMVTRVIQIGVPTRKLWGAPFTQLAVAIRNALGEVNDLLEQRLQLKAAKRVRVLLGEIRACPASLQSLRQVTGALRKSRDWREQRFATVARQFERITELIENLPTVLDPVSRNLRQTLMQLEGYVKKGDWAKATEELDRFVARCEW